MRKKGKTLPRPYSSVKDAAFWDVAIRAISWPHRRTSHLFRQTCAISPDCFFLQRSKLLQTVSPSSMRQRPDVLARGRSMDSGVLSSASRSTIPCTLLLEAFSKGYSCHGCGRMVVSIESFSSFDCVGSECCLLCSVMMVSFRSCGSPFFSSHEQLLSGAPPCRQ